MPTVQIKNVPPDVHQVLRRRAAEAGQSLQEYMLAYLTDFARKPTVEEIFDRIEQRAGGGLSLDFIVQAQREDRESH
jgi:plasmid stability protein